MIPNIVRGTRVGGLIRYLYGPGKREEHVNPHLVAAWDGAGRLSKLEPLVGVDGRRDFRQLIDLLEQPVHNARNPPRKHVWHCSIRTDPTDRWLTDEQWAHIGGEVMAAVGLAPHGDPKAVRWVAIRHGPDHIHIVATLVRQDRRTAWGRNDYWLAQAACRDLERRYGLRRLGPADRTGHRRPTAPELNKARRTGRRETSRDRLRREVRFAAATAGGEGEFFALLHQAGLLARARTSSIHPDQITGYAVATPDDTTATGEPVWYSGGKLATDLTLPQLRSRWGQPAAAADSATRVQRRKPGVVPVVCHTSALPTADGCTVVRSLTAARLPLLTCTQPVFVEPPSAPGIAAFGAHCVRALLRLPLMSDKPRTPNTYAATSTGMLERQLRGQRSIA
ncbi:MAG: hypothetical protein J2P15_07335 [Micromonosporaceae bacterium]|nr:hypothetical protein [Micromonosporaceae bacterium]